MAILLVLEHIVVWVIADALLRALCSGLLQHLDLLVVQIADAEHNAVIELLHVPGLRIATHEGVKEARELLVHRHLADSGIIPFVEL